MARPSAVLITTAEAARRLGISVNGYGNCSGRMCKPSKQSSTVDRVEIIEPLTNRSHVQLHSNGSLQTPHYHVDVDRYMSMTNGDIILGYSCHPSFLFAGLIVVCRRFVSRACRNRVAGLGTKHESPRRPPPDGAESMGATSPHAALVSFAGETEKGAARAPPVTRKEVS